MAVSSQSPRSWLGHSSKSPASAAATSSSRCAWVRSGSSRTQAARTPSVSKWLLTTIAPDQSAESVEATKFSAISVEVSALYAGGVRFPRQCVRSSAAPGTRPSQPMAGTSPV